VGILALLSCGIGGSPAAAPGHQGPVASVASVDAGSDPGNQGDSASDSLDWAGYVVTGHTFSGVSGAWRQPGVTCTATKASQSAFWVGLDGFSKSDQTVEQIGTDSDCSKASKKAPGVAEYYAWYELFPAGLVVLPTGTYAVTPGDQLSASVHVSGTTYTLVLQDGQKWTYSATVNTPTTEQNASAEWIAESPSTCQKKCKPGLLADFGSVTFTNASADSTTLVDEAAAAQPITMTTKKAAATLAVPSAVSAASGFVVTWLSL
jgi:hypothetical protein